MINECSIYLELCQNVTLSFRLSTVLYVYASKDNFNGMVEPHWKKVKSTPRWSYIYSPSTGQYIMYGNESLNDSCQMDKLDKNENTMEQKLDGEFSKTNILVTDILRL